MGSAVGERLGRRAVSKWVKCKVITPVSDCSDEREETRQKRMSGERAAERNGKENSCVHIGSNTIREIYVRVIGRVKTV